VENRVPSPSNRARSVLTATVAVLTLLDHGAIAAEVGWRDSAGKPAPESPAQRSVNGFGGWLMVTPDKDWKEKWNTPAESTPMFTTADHVRQGETITILVFFSNAKLTADRSVNITCDLRVTRPDKTFSIDEKAVTCASGPIPGPATNLYLSNLVLGFVGEPNDPPGKWLVEVMLHDNVAKIDIPLQTSFVLKQ
jgi:hypothetical protein